MFLKASKIDDLETEKAKLLEDCSQTKEELKQEKERCQKLNGKLLESARTIEQIASEKESLNLEIKSLRIELAKLQSKLTDKDSSIINLQDENKELVIRIAESELQNASLLENISIISKKKDSLRDDIVKLTTQSKKMQSSIKKLKQDLSEKDIANKEKDSKIIELEEEIERQYQLKWYQKLFGKK